jgi:SPP1 family phage portal protein
MAESTATTTAAVYNYRQLIEDCSGLIAQYSEDYNKYCGESLPILSRTMPDANKINNKLPHDYRGEIVDQIVGYLFGKPVTYQLEKELYGSNTAAYDKDNVELAAWMRRVDVADLDAETAKRTAIMGVCYRLCYIDGDGTPNVEILNPWEVVFIDKDNAFAFSLDANSKYLITHYDTFNITTYQEIGEGEFAQVTQTPHLFGRMPIVQFVNNDEQLPDFRKVEELIDAYDRTMSDAQNELEEFRQAYLFAKGIDIDAETVQMARSSGAFGSEETDADMKFLTKDVNDQFLEHHKDTLKNNIYRFSQTVDMSDEKFSGSGQTGESRKWKLFALENKAATKERKFAKGLANMFRVLCTAWAAKGFTLSWESISFSFDRNLPAELLTEAEIQQKLAGLVATDTRLGLASFITDPAGETEKFAAEFGGGLDTVSSAEDDTNDGGSE